MSLSEGTLVAVYWRDITVDHGWHSFKKAGRMRPVRCLQVGFVVKDGRKFLRLTEAVIISPRSHRSTGAVSTIPKGCIERIEEI